MACSLKLKGHACISGVITCKTGMRIGGSKDDIDVGGTDSPIIRDPLTGLPYIPGSSLKGKLRSYLEYKYGKVKQKGLPCGCCNDDCLVCKVFGPHLTNVSNREHDLGPTRIIVRDAHLSKESQERFLPLLQQGINYAELKRENIINRATGVAADLGLRTGERTLASAKFDFTIHVRIFEGDPEDRILSFIEEGLEGLRSEYLGGSGTRGYGWVDVDYTVRKANGA